jgi:hypothetical protein
MHTPVSTRLVTDVIGALVSLFEHTMSTTATTTISLHTEAHKRTHHTTCSNSSRSTLLMRYAVTSPDGSVGTLVLASSTNDNINTHTHAASRHTHRRAACRASSRHRLRPRRCRHRPPDVMVTCHANIITGTMSTHNGS